MITNDYTNILPENAESGLSILSFTSPHLSIRAFDFNLVRGETELIIPYYVGDCKCKDYTEDELAPTFTTVFALDEDKEPDESGSWKTWKKTTYSGEQIINLGKFEEEGIHNLCVRTIQSNGVSSPTRLLRFIVRKPESEYTVLDMNSTRSFSGTLNDYTTYRVYYTGGNYVAAKFIINAKYTVSCDVVDESVVDITINVSQIQNKPTLACYSTNKDGDTVSLYSSKDISGTFHLATTCTVNGTVKSLADYIDSTYSNIPEAVSRTAANNKVALTRLFEAAKAAGADKFVLPRMNIVCDYHFSGDNFDESITQSSGDKTYMRDDVLFPNNIIIDMNGSSLNVLHAGQVHQGKILFFINNIDTHLINGCIQGNYKYEAFSARAIGEGRSVVMLHGCQFCSLNHVDVSYTVGYDVCISSTEMNLLERFALTKRGYIDYNGEEVGGTDVYGDGLAPYSGLMHSASFNAALTNNAPVLGPIVRIVKWNNGDSDQHLNSRRDIFLHFYDSSNKFVKTVKTSSVMPTLVPYGATKFKATMYGTSVMGSADSVNLDTTHGAFCGSNLGLSWCSGVYDCNIHDARAYQICNGGVQTIVKNCKVWNICAERYPSRPFSESTFNIDNGKHIFDCEDDSLTLVNPVWENVEFLYGDADNIVIRDGFDLHFKDCKNLSISVVKGVTDVFIDKCSCSFGVGYNYMTAKSHIMVKNSIINSINNGGDYPTSNMGATTGRLTIKNCDVESLNGPYSDKINVKQNIKM